MHPLLLLTTLFITALAAPATSPVDSLDLRGDYGDKGKPRCPTNPLMRDGQLPKGAIFPSVLLPLSRKRPNEAFRDTGRGKITPNDFCTYTMFEIPYKPNSRCNLIWSIPSYEQAGHFFSFSGRGNFEGGPVSPTAIPGKTTWNTRPRSIDVPADTGSPRFVLQPGNSYVINSGPTPVPPKGEKTSRIAGITCSRDTKLVWEPRANPCPVGSFVIVTFD